MTSTTSPFQLNSTTLLKRDVALVGALRAFRRSTTTPSHGLADIAIIPKGSVTARQWPLATDGSPDPNVQVVLQQTPRTPSIVLHKTAPTSPSSHSLLSSGASRQTRVHAVSEPDTPSDRPRSTVLKARSQPQIKQEHIDKPKPALPRITTPRNTPITTSIQSTSENEQSITATYKQLYPSRPETNISPASLTNAMLASSLASMRLSSPSLQQHSPPGRQVDARHLQVNSGSRKPIMPMTLRSDASDDSSSDQDMYAKHKKKRHIRKHPNRHAEGDRKRWRDAVTDRERRRYEGLWAANRGMSSESSQARNDGLGRSTDKQDVDTVPSYVVRDIWSRSRLPRAVLHETWDLVASKDRRRLTKEEFIVGLWLIDQKLKGRKLPSKVGDSVWNSVRFPGIKIPTH